MRAERQSLDDQLYNMKRYESAINRLLKDGYIDGDGNPLNMSNQIGNMDDEDY